MQETSLFWAAKWIWSSFLIVSSFHAVLVKVICHKSRYCRLQVMTLFPPFFLETFIKRRCKQISSVSGLSTIIIWRKVFFQTSELRFWFRYFFNAFFPFVSSSLSKEMKKSLFCYIKKVMLIKKNIKKKTFEVSWFFFFIRRECKMSFW